MHDVFITIELFFDPAAMGGGYRDVDDDDDDVMGAITCMVMSSSPYSKRFF